jgi:hypothetical protein
VVAEATPSSQKWSRSSLTGDRFLVSRGNGRGPLELDRKKTRQLLPQCCVVLSKAVDGPFEFSDSCHELLRIAAQEIQPLKCRLAQLLTLKVKDPNSALPMPHSSGENPAIRNGFAAVAGFANEFSFERS